MDAQSYFLCIHNKSTYLVHEKNENCSAARQKKKRKAKKLSFYSAASQKGKQIVILTIPPN